MKSDSAAKDLSKKKRTSREHVRSLPLEDKIEKLVELQGQYYEMLKLRASNGGLPIPAKWQRWRSVRRNHVK
ncbi:MAG: hypothetical protein ABIV21_06295 [Pyrinomonadaceae bacterium]